ncbi:hypothetical protein LZ575_00420 [Antarcticibacterium sp. 1MA-6-2]|uniref:ABC transporter transmembrane domain-containing protein n=1 Tax=Antarcticibacterium sp. 1MA-6-2 TaxID=2908210 RepID=UPI001EFF47D4|nr:ABC transporter transmembrane domain-containing protein [Antarcticibacterium sp. 1MA-6-2]UJH91305.1 hypothetical protein LZ575_00420 [Antarcticibacterium sp. 1MA-6-2]
MIKRLAKKYFESLAYFYSYSGYRIVVIVALSIFVGLLDGFGLAMFIPLLEMVSDSSGVEAESMGRLSFLLEFVNDIGLSLSLATILGFMTIMFFLKGIMQYINGVYRMITLQKFIKKVRFQNIKGLNNLAYKYFVSADVGRIQNTLTGEVDRVAFSFANYFYAVQFGVMVIVYMSFAFAMDPQFAILVTIGGALTNFLYKNLYKKTKGASRKLT